QRMSEKNTYIVILDGNKSTGDLMKEKISTPEPFEKPRFTALVCDRIIRACNQRLGSGPLQPDHQGRLVDLVELAVKGYGLNADPAVSGCPLYLEKIIFHILQKLVSQGAHGPASRLGELMYHRLQTYSTEAEALSVLVRNCFAVLWNGLLTPGSRAPSIPPRDRLRWQLQALLFRLMEGTSNTSKVPLFVEEVVGEFERACGGLSQDDAAFLLSELQMRFLSPPLGENAGGDCVQMLPFLAVRCQVIFKVCKLLCKGKFWTEASGLVDSAVAMVRRLCDILCPSLGLAAHAVQLQCALTSGDECSKAFTDCARILRGLPATMRDIEAHTLLEACQLVVWAIEAGQTKGMDRTTLLACFSFLEEYQEILLKQQKVSPWLCLKLHTFNLYTNATLFCSHLCIIFHILFFKLKNLVVKLCNSSIFLSSSVVCAVNNVVYELFNRKLYEEAFGLAEIMCQELRKDCPASLPVERCSRRVSQMEKALDWVVSWIQVLGARVLDHLAEPVSLWVKTKCDAARAGEEDTRLRTLRDGLGATLIDEEVLLRLLEEELRLYKDQTGDTAQERYNTLCDLLDICHEDTTHTLRRASYLCEMAQVVCYQDFSQQTDCSAVDFTHEALRLLDEEQETAENADRLNDEKAYASLWLYICTLEANLQEGITTGNLDPVPTNDLEYEDKQKTQDSQLVYDGLRFNLVAHNKRSKPLDRCLSLWRSLLKEGKVPAVRDPTNTAYSISLMASLYTLMGKPLQALEGYQLSAALFRLLGDGQNSAGAFCQSARLLLDLGSPQLSQVQLEQAEQCLAAESGSEAVTVISVTITLLRAQLYYALGEVKRGVCSLSEVLKQTAQHHSKSWYMLKARALQVASAYLSLDTSKLQTLIRQTIIQRGVKTPDTAQYEGLKLLCSLVMSLLGNGFYGAPAPNVDTRFVDRGKNSVVFKWLLLGEVLLCSERMVQIRSSSGAAHEAKAQCLEALKLATKLHTLSHCAELLVLKAELELMKGSSEASTLDLEQVRHLLDDGTGNFYSLLPFDSVKIKPRKGRPAVATPARQTSAEDEDIDGLLSSRSLGREPVDGLSDLGQDASPTLKPKRQRALSCLTHGESCSCSCCSEPTLVRVSVLWALVQADLQKELQYSCRLRHFAKLRCSSITAKIQSRLKTLISSNFSPRQSLVPSMLQAEVARLHLGTVLTQLHCGAGEKEKAASLWEEIEAGLQAVEDKGALCPELGPLRAALLGAKAVVCCLALAGKKQCSPDDLFSAVWGWNPSLTAVALKIKTQLKQQNRLKSSGDGDQLNPAAKTSAKTLPILIIIVYLINFYPPLPTSIFSSKLPQHPHYLPRFNARKYGFLLYGHKGNMMNIFLTQRYYKVLYNKVILPNLVLTCVVNMFSCVLCLSIAELSLEVVRSLLCSAWVLLHHFPSPSLYPHLCSLLAQLLGLSDPLTTAMLHAQSMGVTVCLLSLVAVSPGEIGSTILLTRLEHDCDPITIRIPTAHRPGVLQGQKEVSNVADKVQWWDCRKALDARVQVRGEWLSLDQRDHCGVNAASAIIRLNVFSQMAKNPLFLIFFVCVSMQYLQRLPWENISCLRPRSVSRLPSLQVLFLLEFIFLYFQMNSDCVLSRGVDPQQVYFVLNPDGNLPETEKRFRDWFTSEKTWQGVCGVSPDPDKLQEAITTKDLYIYVGHGAGARFLDAQRVMKGPVQAAALLFGCSSAALSVQGCLEGTGIILSYLIAGCPLVLGNLWDVTDRDIDRFTSALLQSWLSGGSGSSLLQHLSTSRDATHLKHMIGAAPIAYGLPVHLQ
uniref:separase n=1 Tax=Astyanax mexicanus TaxID=7994 RepID=A0A3B1ISX3_ASTMX